MSRWSGRIFETRSWSVGYTDDLVSAGRPIITGEANDYGATVERAVILDPRDPALLHLALAWCHRRRYKLDSIAPDWARAVDAVVGGVADVVVVATPEQLDPHRLPRSEVVQWPQPTGDGWSTHRPRIRPRVVEPPLR